MTDRSPTDRSRWGWKWRDVLSILVFPIMVLTPIAGAAPVGSLIGMTIAVSYFSRPFTVAYVGSILVIYFAFAAVWIRLVAFLWNRLLSHLD